MPRTARIVEAGLYYHVLNRGNGRQRLFRKEDDFDAFEQVLAEGLERYPVDVLTYCLMGNHWHLVVRPGTDAALGQLLGWVGVTHVRRHHAHYRTSGGGHLYQGRYKSFPVQDDDHFLTLCRYVEANARRAGLCDRAEAWRWSGGSRRSDRPIPLTDWPVDKPRNWTSLLNHAQDRDVAKRIQTSIDRGRPFGTEDWTNKIADRLGLGYTIAARGRPRVGKE